MPVPRAGVEVAPFSYCPACRSADIEFQQHKLVCCSACGFHYFHNVATAVAAVIRCRGEVLFAVRAHAPARGMLDLPGGFADPGESLEQALQREIREELGLAIDSARYLFSCANTYPYKGVVYRTTDALFEIELKHKPVIEPADDVAEIRWLELQRVDVEAIAFDSVRQAVARLLQR